MTLIEAEDYILETMAKSFIGFVPTAKKYYEALQVVRVHKGINVTDEESYSMAPEPELEPRLSKEVEHESDAYYP